ncbi:LacI family transcriptional regulator [Lentzea aerocolonigenes]|uniref:LacI family transcriptional regulator n=1 Tax=Lentzea aerocolonigenes TaxID=68170 RepID=A0A0F0GTR3_LENAE|nr:LacI family DNA-binding transcriptional regulator [Lentzea aerocolonigenes]KJK46879.1 LacI family transcriptional regulator [Lentzea aerocolonigenes]
MATLKDVARLAGVSVKTVSNVVNGYSFVKPDNRARVEAALEATGYRPNLGARNLRRGRTGFIALVLPELSIPYFAELAGLVIAAAQEHEWNVLIEQTFGTLSGERLALASLGPHLVDAAILSPEALQVEDFQLSVPAVMLGEHAVDVPLSRVGIDNVAAATFAVRHLISLGRRRIAAIGAHPQRGTAALRLEGYRAALAEAGLPFDSSLVVPALNYHRADGAAAMKALLDMRNPPDAVFCFNDLLAVGAMRTAAERFVRVPQDLAIVGFDNNDESAYSSPSLTSIAPDKAAIARAAVNLLRERAGSPDLELDDVQTPFSLQVRESTVAR